MRRLKTDVEHLYHHIGELYAEIEKLKKPTKAITMDRNSYPKKKAKKRPANGVNGGFEWGSHNHKELARLFNEGHNLSYLAEFFGRSENAVDQQILKLKRKGLI